MTTVQSVKPKILIVVDSPGPADSIASILKPLGEHAQLLVLAIGKACDVLREYPITCIDDERIGLDKLSAFKPDLFLQGISSLVNGPFISNNLTRSAKGLGYKVVVFQDFWANHRWPTNLAMFPNWDSILTVDNLALDFIKSDGFKGEILVTGNPAYDKFFEVDVLTERTRLRRMLDLPADRKIVLYVGQGTPATLEPDIEAFTFMFEVLRKIEIQPALIVRAHPRAETISHYQKNSAGLEIIHTPEFFLTDELLPIADVVVSMFATNLIHASILGLPTVSLMLPKVSARLKEINLDDFPLNTIESTTPIYETDHSKAVQIFSKLLSDDRDSRFKQKRPDQLKPGAIQRTVEAILKQTPNLLQ